MQDSTTINSYQDFTAAIKQAQQTATADDIAIVNPYQVNLYMEQQIQKLQQGEKLPQDLYDKVRIYQPDIDLYISEDDKKNQQKLLIVQLYPLLLQQRYQQQKYTISKIPENTILFNMLYNIDSVAKEAQISNKIPEEAALTDNVANIFINIPIAQKFITKYVKPQSQGTPCYIGLYYSDDYIFLSQTPKFSSPKQLEKLYPSTYISLLKMLRYENFVSQNSQLISRSIVDDINSKESAVSAIEKSPLPEENKRIIHQIINKKYENFDINTNKQVKQIISFAIEFYNNQRYFANLEDSNFSRGFREGGDSKDYTIENMSDF